ncbi:MAG: GAF domain-containing sensor histidine kinase [Caldilineaceae bacterium]
MRWPEEQFSHLLNGLRWIIPGLLALLGASYILLEGFWLTPDRVAPVHILRQALIIGTLGPTLAWALLTWANRIARYSEAAEIALRRRARQLEAANQISRKATTLLDMDQLLPQVVQLIQSHFGYYHVHLLLVDGQSNKLVLRECSGEVESVLLERGLQLEIDAQSIVGTVAQRGQALLCNNIGQEWRYQPHELLAQARSEVAVPLKIGQQILGVLDVQSEQVNAFQPDDLTLLQTLGDQVAIAIRNAHLFQETRHQFHAMRALHEIALKVTSRLGSNQILSGILEEAAHFLHAQGSALSLYDTTTHLIRIAAVHNFPREYLGATLQVGEGGAGQVIATQQPVVINDYQQWAERSKIFQDSPYNVILSVPLRWEQAVFGVLTVLDHNAHRIFTSDDVQLMSFFADLASISLKNAELYDQVVQLSQQLEQKVEQRTAELLHAQEELAQQAAQLQRLLQVTVRVQEDERVRIARDLHDGSNQLITGTLFELQAAQESLRGGRAAVAVEKVETAKGLLREIEAEHRRLIAGLRPSVLDTQGVVFAVKWYVESLKTHHTLDCSVRVCGQPVRLAPDAEIAIYRIVQEALNNVTTHARAVYASIRFHFEQSHLAVIIQDDGIGFDPAAHPRLAGNHLGLIGMQERAQSIGGQLQVQSTPNEGTKIVLELPITAGSHAAGP